MSDVPVPEKPQTVVEAGAVQDADSGQRDGIFRQGGRPYRSWRIVLLRPQGAGGPTNVPPEELDAVITWLGELEESLTDPSPVDLSLLGSLGRISLLELRLARSVFKDGAMTSKGAVKSALTELRATTILKLKILSRLPARSKARPDVEPLTFVDHDAEVKP